MKVTTVDPSSTKTWAVKALEHFFTLSEKAKIEWESVLIPCLDYVHPQKGLEGFADASPPAGCIV